MNTTTHAAQEGWRMFSNALTPPPLEEINTRLRRHGLLPISARMYKHYRALRRHGRREYIPINELDVAVKASRHSN